MIESIWPNKRIRLVPLARIRIDIEIETDGINKDKIRRTKIVKTRGTTRTKYKRDVIGVASMVTKRLHAERDTFPRPKKENKNFKNGKIS